MATEMVKTNSSNKDLYIVPVTDIYETHNDYTLKLEIPGVDKDNIEITLDNNELEIKAKVAADSGENVKYSEYTLYDYYRKFKVGDDINRNNINAKVDNGVLTLTLNKSEEVKPRKIEISVN